MQHFQIIKKTHRKHYKTFHDDQSKIEFPTTQRNQHSNNRTLNTHANKSETRHTCYTFFQISAAKLETPNEGAANFSHPLEGAQSPVMRLRHRGAPSQ